MSGAFQISTTIIIFGTLKERKRSFRRVHDETSNAAASVSGHLITASTIALSFTMP
jgi:hypothetical protein